MRAVLAGCMLFGLQASMVAQEGPTSSLPPKGFGTLRQADVAIVVRTADVQITLLPLDERVTRLLATDSYDALQSLLADRTDEINRAIPGRRIEGLRPFLVTVYAATDYARFDPEQITITNRNRYFRSLTILPISARWAEHQLDRGQSRSALYVFDGDLDPLHPMIVEYGATRVATWETTLHRLEIERSRVDARARGSGPLTQHVMETKHSWSYIRSEN